MPGKRWSATAWIVIGVAAMLMSFFIDWEKMAFFILAGAIMVVYGFLKILTQEKREAKAHVERPHKPHHQPAHHTAPSHQPAHGSAQHKPSHVVHHAPDVRCSGCGVRLHPRFKYCPNCGHRLH